MVRGIKYENGALEIVDQLSTEEVLVKVGNVEDGWTVIHNMQVRGEVTTAIVACLSLAVDMAKDEFADKNQMQSEIVRKVNFLLSANPRSPVLRPMCDNLIAFGNGLLLDEALDVAAMKKTFIEKLESSLEQDFADI